MGTPVAGADSRGSRASSAASTSLAASPGLAAARGGLGGSCLPGVPFSTISLVLAT